MDSEIDKYNLKSETFKKLNDCIWWVQNVFLIKSRAKDLAEELDFFCSELEKTAINKKSF